MSRFDPQPGDQIGFNSASYEVMPHPAVPTMAFGQEGRKAVVYQLKSSGKFFALKIFKKLYREAYLVDTCRALAQLIQPGLEVCKRECLTQRMAGSLLRQYPEMEYAILMPWIQGTTWFDIVHNRTPLSQDACKKLAQHTAALLSRLEARGYSHSDVAGSNVIVNAQTGYTNLIDVEDMFGPDLPVPNAFPQGTDGYQHRMSRAAEEGQWCAEGDRFSAAVLLAEMLAWHDPKIREARDAASFFAPEELQDAKSARYQLMLSALAAMSGEIADCFEVVWGSAKLVECPSLSEWLRLLRFPLVTEWLPILAPIPAAPYLTERQSLDRAGAFRSRFTFSSNQTLDYPIAFEEFAGGYIRYLYARSASSRANSGEGQDYLSWSYTQDALGFVICDGVGSSFCGNIAAKYLGDQLIHFLFDVGPRLDAMDNATTLAKLATKYLNQWQQPGHREVEKVKLPEGLSPSRLQALDRLRRERGSETVFACGRLSLGGKSNKLVLIWMGDTEIQLFDRQGQPFEIGGRWRNIDFWSTRRGVSTNGVQVNAWVGDFQELGIERIIIFSDGLSSVAHQLHCLSDDDVQRQVEMQLMSPSGYDTSFIDIGLKPPYLSDSLDAPVDLRVTSDRKLVWTEVAGAEKYELEEADDGLFLRIQSYELMESEWPLINSSLSSKAVYRYFRVRARVGRRSSPWGRALRVLPAVLSAPEQTAPRPKARSEVCGPEAPHLLPIENPHHSSPYVVQWTEVTDAWDYELYESRTPDFVQERLVDRFRSNRHRVWDKEPGVYYYRVFSRNKEGTRSDQPSHPQSTKVALNAPRWVVGNWRQETSDIVLIQLCWRRVEAAEKYELRRVDASNNEKLDCVDQDQSKTIDVSVPLTEGVYDFYVRAVGQPEPSTWSARKRVEVLRRANQLTVRL